MKKVLVTAVVTAMLMVPANVMAETTTSKGLTISFDNIEELISEYNPTVKVSNHLLDILEHQYDVNEDQIDDEVSQLKQSLTDQVTQYDIRIDNLNNFKDIYTMIKDQSSDESVIDDCEAKILEYNNEINTLMEAKTGLQAQEEDIDEMREDLEDELDEDYKLDKRETRCQISLNCDTQVYQAQMNYLGYLEHCPELKEARNQLELLNKKQDAMNLKQSLGMTTQADLDELQVDIKNAELKVDSLEREMNDIEGSLNLALGKDYDKELTIEPLPDLDWEKIRNIDYEEDLENALSENYNLKLKKVDLANMENEADRADDSDEEDIADIQSEDLEIQIKEMKRKIELAFNQAHQDLLTKENALEVNFADYNNGITSLNQAKIKYEIGLISYLDYLEAQNNYDIVEHQYQNSQQAVLEAFTVYQWVVKGLIPSLNSK